MNDNFKEFLNKAISFPITLHLSSHDFNNVLEHIYDLLKNAVDLYCNGNYTIPVFLSITAIEEKAKLEVLLYRHAQEENTIQHVEQINNRNDPLFNHRIKHCLGISPVLNIGSRLPKAIGKERVDYLIKQSRTNGFRTEREESLYFDFSNGTLSIPNPSKEKAKDFMLLAIESIDDGLIGYTNYSMTDISPKLDTLWNRVIQNDQ